MSDLAATGRERCVLTINGGSSSIKFAVYTTGQAPNRVVSGGVDRIGLGEAMLTIREADGQSAAADRIDAPDHASAVGALLDRLGDRVPVESLAAVGHRIVHGGERYIATSLIDDALLAELRRLSPLDPAHLPGEIAIIKALRAAWPGVPQFACFDTAFHRDLPRVARLLPVPRRYATAGIRRYGFHGLSYAYLMDELRRLTGNQGFGRRVILAHLGAGCSLAAVRDGKCIDTTMGFTPTAGLVMGRRSGDLDPGFLIHLMREERLSADQIDKLVNQQSGLLGISETSPDLRDLLAREEDDVRAADAVALFCYQARKWIGAFAAALGGLDTLVFTAGIGENSPVIRARVCHGLEFLGVTLDPARNESNAGIISNDASAVCMRVIHTDEELMIVREVQRLLAA
jgi:acetate kinase